MFVGVDRQSFSTHVFNELVHSFQEYCLKFLIIQEHKRTDIYSAHSWVHATMLPHIDVGKGRINHFLCGFEDCVCRPYVGEYGSICTQSSIDEPQIYFGYSMYGRTDFFQHIGVRCTDIRNTFYAVVFGHSSKMKAFMKSVVSSAKARPA